MLWVLVDTQSLGFIRYVRVISDTTFPCFRQNISDLHPSLGRFCARQGERTKYQLMGDI